MLRRPRGKKRKMLSRGQFSGGFSHAGLPQWSGDVDENTVPDTRHTFTQISRVVPTQNSVDDINSSTLLGGECFGFLNTSIVGVRYYSGMVSNRELVSLQREPNNVYDCNAVRVNNALGQQVGHIKKELAKAMAPLMDNALTRVEGLVPRGSNNVYTIPIILSFWGEIENQDSVRQAIKKQGFNLNVELPTGKGYGTGFNSSFYPQPLSRSSVLTSSQVKSELDNLFENLKEIDQTTEVDQNKAVTTPLFRHQRQALCWMIRRELGSDLPPFWEQVTLPDGKRAFKNTVTNFHTVVEPGKLKGGILADDMGLGKTLVVISLIVGNCSGNKPMFQPVDEDDCQMDFHSSEVKATNNLSLPQKVGIGDNGIPVIDLTEDEPLTNANGQKNRSKRHRNVQDRPKRATKRPSRYINEVVDYEIPENTQLKKEFPPKRNLLHFQKISEEKKPTLIICPLSVISNWEGQIKEHLHDSVNISVLVYHCMSKLSKTKQKLLDQDVVITTYQTLAQEFKKSSSRGRLLATDWLRIVLDEGHVIRNPSALQTKACRSLKAERKWVLSGTPIQNSIKDLWTIVSFLGLEPFTERSWWQRTIERPLRNGEADAIKRVQGLLGAICMRRTKHQKLNGKPIVDLPTKEVVLTKLEMSLEERVIYNKMDAETKKAIKNMIDDGSVMTRYAEVLVVLLRLRQICCHLSLAKDAIDQLNTGSAVPVTEAKELISKLIMLLGSGSVEECCVCLDSLSSPVITRCAHIFCKPCIFEVIHNSEDSAKCPLCRGDVKENELMEVPPETNEDAGVKGDEATVPSSKIRALMSELVFLKEKEPGVRSLVVSQFTSFLQIIAKHLRAKGLTYVYFHGGLTSSQRQEALETFQRGAVSIMLLSLKSGGVGLNLTAASRVFLMEPAWNPAAEEQCFDRVHRLGQTKQVKIVKYVCANSVEERITNTQSAKRNLAEKSLLRLTKHEERQQKRMEDLRMLMNI